MPNGVAKFISGEEIPEEIKSALSAADEAKLAVAFWGDGALDRLGLSEFQGKAQIVCDLWSGACNPGVISELLERFEVRTLGRMHAKVYWTPKKAVAGSANASSNGLGSEGTEVLEGWEAAVALTEAPALHKISGWFDKVWDAAEPVSKQDINKAKANWKWNRDKRPLNRRVGGAPLYDAIRANPEDFADRKTIQVWYYEENENSPEAKADLKNFKKEHDIMNNNIDTYEMDTKYADEIDIGSLIFDFTYNQKRGIYNPSFNGIWKFIHSREFKKGTSNVIVEKLTKIKLGGNSFTRIGSAKEWEQRIREHLEREASVRKRLDKDGEIVLEIAEMFRP